MMEGPPVRPPRPWPRCKSQHEQTVSNSICRNDNSGGFYTPEPGPWEPRRCLKREVPTLAADIPPWQRRVSSGASVTLTKESLHLPHLVTIVTTPAHSPPRSGSDNGCVFCYPCRLPWADILRILTFSGFVNIILISNFGPNCGWNKNI